MSKQTYIDLRKLFFTDPHRQKEIYLERFNSFSSYKLDFMINGNQAFFVESKEVTDLTYQIGNLNAQIIILSHMLPHEALTQYTRKCLIDEIVLTNKIEGITSTRKDINEILCSIDHRLNHRKRFISIVKAYNKLAESDKIRINSCDDIRKVYDEVLLKEVLAENRNNKPDGKIFRKDPNELQSSSGRIIHHGLYPEEKIIQAMNKAIALMNDDQIKHLHRCCIFHYLLEYIHPFYDGNGRLGRLILSYSLAEELNSIVSFRISEQIIEKLNQYYQIFTLTNDSRNMGDLTPFLIYMLSVIKDALEDLSFSLVNKIQESEKYTEYAALLTCGGIIPDISSVTNLLINASLFSEIGISTEQLESQLHISYQTLRRRLSLLKEKDLLIVTKQGQSVFYQMNLKTLDSMIISYPV